MINPIKITHTSSPACLRLINLIGANMNNGLVVQDILLPLRTLDLGLINRRLRPTSKFGFYCSLLPSPPPFRSPC
jgi:hypothetical protein